MIRFCLVLILCELAAHGRRIGRGEKWRLEDGGWQEDNTQAFNTWLEEGNEAVVAADTETLRNIEHQIDKLEEAEADVEADIEKRLRYRAEEEEDVVQYLANDGIGRRIFNM